MDEATWLACSDPVPMLQFLQGKATERKLRLFACASARLLWDHMPEGVMRQAVEAGERFADGVTPWDREFVSQLHILPVAYRKETGRSWFSDHGRASMPAFFGAIHAAAHWCGLSEVPDRAGWTEHTKATGPQQPALLRDIFSPFRPVVFESAWGTPDVITLAGHIYHDRAFTLMGDLADAVEVGGCTNEGVLAHLRGPGPHVRGCAVLDAILGKE